MSRNVKGTLFVDYVRMIRSHKEADWGAHLNEHELAMVQERVQPGQWYAMEAFERFGNAILAEIGGGDLEQVRLWGRLSAEDLSRVFDDLIAPGDPRESLMRFKVLRGSFFDFEAIKVTMLLDHQAHLRVDYQMGPTAEEAAVYQTLGFFEHLLALAGATEVEAALKSRSWTGDEHTVIALSWTTPA